MSQAITTKQAVPKEEKLRLAISGRFSTKGQEVAVTNLKEELDAFVLDLCRAFELEWTGLIANYSMSRSHFAWEFFLTVPSLEWHEKSLREFSNRFTAIRERGETVFDKEVEHLQT